VLIQNPETVVLKDYLMKTVWPDTFVEEANLSQHIFMLRKTLGDAVEEKLYVITVPGRGYRFAGSVRAVEAEDLEDLSVRDAEAKDSGRVGQVEQIVVANR
jgi:eukaryotic-like serine/threonine-protein kinase